MKPVKVAITGPESTGKSWLALHLALHYNTLWVPEYAREYLKPGKAYQADDVVQIAIGQLKLEKAIIKKKPALLFVDTELLVCKIWLDYVFGQKNELIEEGLKKQHYEMYLLCDIDLAWEPDPLRTHPYQREELFRLYEYWLQQYEFPYRIVSGKGKERLEKAVNFVDQLRRP